MILDATGKVIERRAQLPERNVHLEDGRIMRYRGNCPGISGSATFQAGDGLRVIASIDPNQHGNLLHVSISYADRDPSWEDIKQVRYAFFGDDIDAMMVLPKKADYVNIHNHCFHIWQTPQEWAIQ